MASIKSIRRFTKPLRLPKPLRRLIEKTGDINSEDAHKYTTLMYISEDGLDDKIIEVLEMGANINAVDKFNATALTHAISCKRWSTAILLLEKGADPNINYWNGQEKNLNGLCLATGYQQLNVVLKLIEKGADVNAIIESVVGTSPILISSIMYKCDDVILVAMLDAGADPNGTTNEGLSVLFVAIEVKLFSFISILLSEYRTDVNYADDKGRTALMNAAKFGYQDVIIELLAAGADVNAKCNSGFTALNVATTNGRKDCVILLLAAANIDIHNKTVYGNDSVIIAARCGKHNCLFRLLQAGGRADTVNSNGNDALILAVKNGHTKCVSLLTALKIDTVDPNRVGEMGHNSLTLAIIMNHHACIPQLIKAGANSVIGKHNALLITAVAGYRQSMSHLLECKEIDVDILDEEGHTPLMMTIIRGNYECARLLVTKGGANVDIQDKNGFTALMFAVNLNLYKFVRMLMREGGSGVDFLYQEEKLTVYNLAEIMEVDQKIKQEIKLVCCMCRSTKKPNNHEYLQHNNACYCSEKCKGVYGETYDDMLYGVE